MFCYKGNIENAFNRAKNKVVIKITNRIEYFVNKLGTFFKIRFKHKSLRTLYNKGIQFANLKTGT